METKRNEECIVGLPRCDYVFSSSRSCFIGYGFKESKLEMDLLKTILKGNNIEVFEAGMMKQPAKNIFCTKICSKIITSQFCIVLLNDDNKDGVDIPNANVNMEYGLILGFHKHVIPFQRAKDNLPFNISGLETVKYDNHNFHDRAKEVIELTIENTTPKTTQIVPINNIIETFCLAKDVMVSSLGDEGTRNIDNLGKPLGFYLLNDFGGFSYIYLGIFNTVKSHLVKWRIQKLIQAVTAAFSTIPLRLNLKMIDDVQAKAAKALLNKMQIWVVVQTQQDKDEIVSSTKEATMKVTVFDEEEIYNTVDNLGFEFK